MIIRPSREKITDISDIKHIKEFKRIIIIYEYNKSYFLKEQKLQNKYDFYIFNSSCTLGVGYFVPKGDIVHTSNSYRGCVYNPFLDNNKINPNAIVEIYQSYYVNRYSIDGNLKEPIRISSYTHDVIYRLNEALRLKKTTYFPLVPLPIYYNDEHQVLLANNDYKEFDMHLLDDIPRMTFKDLIDDNTTILNVKIEYEFPENFEATYPLDFDDNPEWILFETYYKLYEITNRVGLKSALIIFDTDEESFNVKELIPIYKETLTKEAFKEDIYLFIYNVQQEFNDFLDKIMYTHTDGQRFPKNTMTFYMYISDTSCKIKIVPHIYGNYKPIINKNIIERSRSDLEKDIVMQIGDF